MIVSYLSVPKSVWSEHLRADSLNFSHRLYGISCAWGSVAIAGFNWSKRLESKTQIVFYIASSQMPHRGTEVLTFVDCDMLRSMANLIMQQMRLQRVIQQAAMQH